MVKRCSMVTSWLNWVPISLSSFPPMNGIRTWMVTCSVIREPPDSGMGESTAVPHKFTGASTIDPAMDAVAMPSLTGPQVSSRRTERSPRCNCVTRPGRL